MAPPPPEGPAPVAGRRTPLDVLSAALRLGPAWGPPAARLVLLLGVALACGFLLSPGLHGHQVPALTEADLGKPFRAPSPAGFKAPRDYDIPHRELTEQRRQEARAAVRPVYDFNPALADELREALRTALAQARAQLAAAPTPRPAGELERELGERLFGPNAGEQEREDLEALVAGGLGPDVEAALLGLLERAYRAEDRDAPAYVAASREELVREGGQGLLVRDVQSLAEQPVSAQAPHVQDVREVQAELDGFASIPGNLLPDAPGVRRRAVLRIARRVVRPNLTINIAETDARRRQAAAAVKDAVVSIKKGQRVIGDGELVNEGHLLVLRGMRAQTDTADLAQVQVGGTLLAALLAAAAYLFCRAAFRRFKPTPRDELLLGLLLVGSLLLAQLWVAVADAVHDRFGALPLEALYDALPFAAGAMLVRFLLGPAPALFFALVASGLLGVAMGNSLALGLYALVGSLVAADRIGRARDRVGILRAGAVTGAAQALMALCLLLAEGKGLSADALVTAAFAFLGGALVVPTLVMAATPLCEAGFGYASDIKLLELANLNHPALKELIVRAPGTYHHSIVVGTLVENAAEAIGANPLLARSCAYFHDLGKGKNPLFFGENQKGENRHDTLAPAMSAVIIKRHVTDGLELARQYRLPRAVADAIPQHHGTRRVGYFFHKAQKEQEGKEGAPPLDESIFRYPGPKPQFREAALVMLADAVEASSRSIAEPTPAKLEAQVQKMLRVLIEEGQLDECDLTFRDLDVIARSFVHTLEGIHHARPAYPPGAVGGAGTPRPVPLTLMNKADGRGRQG